jgi:hypothetical protein
VCKFNDEDSEIKSQIILGCMSHKLRRLALEDDTMTLEKMLDKGRAQEIADEHAKEMESQNGGAVGINHVKTKPGYKGKHSYNQHSYNQNFKKPAFTKSKSSPNQLDKTTSCMLCGGSYPHPGGPTKCSAHGKNCNNCGRQNHFSRVCRRPKPNANQPRRWNQKHCTNHGRQFANTMSAGSSAVLEETEECVHHGFYLIHQ